MKNYSKIFIAATLVAVFAAGYFAFTRGNAETLSNPLAQQDASTTRTVQVSGAGEMQVEPDTAVVRLGVQTDADTAQTALSQNNRKMQALINSLTDAGVASKNIQTQTIRLSPRYDNGGNNNDQTLVGYTASNVVEVRTSDLESLGSLLDDAVKAGANTIENIGFEISNSENLTDQVRQAAVENARHKAEQLAKLTGATLGPVLEIQESSRTPSPVIEQAAAPAASSAAVPISPGSQSISVQVQVTWSLKVNGE
ncbi:MAG: SIMPL domain-containing protein [Anaerolineales bacterium]|jgi:uncharacterized protein